MQSNTTNNSVLNPIPTLLINSHTTTNTPILKTTQSGNQKEKIEERIKATIKKNDKKQ